VAGIWGSFLRFIENGFRNWLAACREPALTQKVSLRLKPYWSFTITTHHFFSPYVLFVSSCAIWQSGIIFFFLTPTVNDLLYPREKLAVGARTRSRALRLRPCALPSNHPCLSLSSQAWRIFVPMRFCKFWSVSRLRHDSRILYPDGPCAVPTNDNSCWGSADYTRHKVSTLHGNLSHELVVDCFCHELSLCAASRMWVRHRSVLIIPPEGGLQSRWESWKRLCFIHVTVQIVSGLPYKIIIESWNTHASSSSQEVLLRHAAPRGSRQEWERSHSVPLTLPASYSLFLANNQCDPQTSSQFCK